VLVPCTSSIIGDEAIVSLPCQLEKVDIANRSRLCSAPTLLNWPYIPEGAYSTSRGRLACNSAGSQVGSDVNAVHYRSMTVEQLRKVLDSRGLTATSRKRKRGLVSVLVRNDEKHARDTFSSLRLPLRSKRWCTREGHLVSIRRNNVLIIVTCGRLRHI